MRLITKTVIYFLGLSLLVFGIGGIVTLRTVKDSVKRETDFALRANMRMVVSAIEAGQPYEAFINEKVAIVPLEGLEKDYKFRSFTDTLAWHRPLKRNEPFRKMTIIYPIHDHHYKISIMDVIIESEDMLLGVIKVMAYLFLFLALVILISAFLLSGNLFSPFHQTLQKIGDFELKGNEDIDLPQTGTKEFSDLNHFINQMVSKARADYHALKEFSENASHEMQTPIAIAQGKLELLQESPGLQADQMEMIQSAQASISKLSKLGQALSLLTKIENQEFSAEDPMDFSETVSKACENFKELIELRGLKFNSNIQKGVQVKIESGLADILVNNLLKNANQHNIQEGWIELELSQANLVVKNSGPEPKVPTTELFKRFKKGNQSKESLGLGLAIISKICQVNQLKLDYQFEDGIHQLVVNFPEP